MKPIIIFVLLFLVSCQSGSGLTDQLSSSNVRYNESPVQPITSPLIVKYRPFEETSGVGEELTVVFDKSGNRKTTNEHSEGTVNLTLLGENLLYHAKVKSDGNEFTMNMLMTERGEILEASLNSPKAARSNKAKKLFESLLSTLKVFSAIYPSEGIITGDNLFAERGEVQVGTYDARIKLNGRVEGLVHSRGRPAILVNMAGSYFVMGSNPKAYMEGWMLLDVNNGIMTRSNMRTVMQLPDSATVEKLIVISSNEVHFPRLVSEQTVNSSEQQFYLDLAWEKLLVGREVFPVMVRQTGRVGYVKSASLIGGKKCDAVFRYDQTGQGDWEVNCTDGTRAVGVLQTLGRGKGSKGSGFDANGNKIDFRIRHEIAE